MFNWNNVHRLTIPEGVVQRVRNGATVLWAGIYRSVRARLGLPLRYAAKSQSLDSTNAQVETATVLDLLSAPTVRQTEPGTGWQELDIKLSASPIVKVRDTGISTVVNEIIPEPKAVSMGSVNAEAPASTKLSTVGVGNGAKAAPAVSLPVEQIRLEGAAAGPEGVLSAAQTVIEAGFTATAAEPVSTPADIVHTTVANAKGTAGGMMAVDMAAVYAMMRMEAAARTAAEWEYPTKKSSYMILDRAAGARLYEAYSGNGLEVS